MSEKGAWGWTGTSWRGTRGLEREKGTFVGRNVGSGSGQGGRVGENRGELGLHWEERGSRSGEGVAGEIRRVVGGFYGTEGESGGDHRGVMGGRRGEWDGRLCS